MGMVLRDPPHSPLTATQSMRIALDEVLGYGKRMGLLMICRRLAKSARRGIFVGLAL